MARIPTLPLILALGSAACSAQTGPSTDSNWNSQTFTIEQFTDYRCPVELKASLDTRATLVLIRDKQADKPTKQFSRKLHVFLKNPGSTAIVSAQFSARGYSSQLRVAPAAFPTAFPTAFIGPSQDQAAIRRVFSFNRTVAPGQQTSVELQLREFGAVTSIELDSAVYADGSVWQPSGYKTCKATPNSKIDTQASQTPH